MANLRVDVTDELLDALHSYAKTNLTSVAAIMRALAEQFLNEQTGFEPSRKIGSRGRPNALLDKTSVVKEMLHSTKSALSASGLDKTALFKRSLASFVDQPEECGPDGRMEFDPASLVEWASRFGFTTNETEVRALLREIGRNDLAER